MRKYEEVSKLMYSIAHRIKLNSENVDDMVQDAWINGSLHACKDHQLSRTIANAMLDARRLRSGRVGSERLSAGSEMVSLSNVTDKSLDALAYCDPNHLETQDSADFFLNMLTFSEHLVVRCRIYRGKTIREIASEWNVAMGLVHKTYTRAINKMKESAKEMV